MITTISKEQFPPYVLANFCKLITLILLSEFNDNESRKYILLGKSAIYNKCVNKEKSLNLRWDTFILRGRGSLSFHSVDLSLIDIKRRNPVKYKEFFVSIKTGIFVYFLTIINILQRTFQQNFHALCEMCCHHNNTGSDHHLRWSNTECSIF